MIIFLFGMLIGGSLGIILMSLLFILSKEVEQRYPLYDNIEANQDDLETPVQSVDRLITSLDNDEQEEPRNIS
ncbi:MAG: hypothetical protein ACW99A_22015 [Candidatus Kariarchaeaceae archaeon]|jgi:hypothetical protein